MSETKSDAALQRLPEPKGNHPTAEACNASTESTCEKTVNVPMGCLVAPVPSGWMPWFPIAYETGVKLLALLKSRGYSGEALRWMQDRGYKRLGELTEMQVVEMLESIEENRLASEI